MRKAAAVLLFTLIAAAALVLLRSPHRYADQDRAEISGGLTRAHAAGTDDLGRDRAVRVAAALLLGLTGAVLASTIATGLAGAVGVAAAFAPPIVAQALLYVCDLFLTLPWLFLLMTVRASLPLTLAPLTSAAVTFLLLAVLGWPAYARVAYAGTLAIRRSDWLIHARACGLTHTRIALRHVLPHLRPLLLSQFLICIPAFLVAEANLGAIGLGISEPLPSWGSMLLELERTSAYTGNLWIYLPIALLVLILLLLEVISAEA
jgi:ABC-type dipeptide/oligopeptide/nickel transport system permease subunit